MLCDVGLHTFLEILIAKCDVHPYKGHCGGVSITYFLGRNFDIFGGRMSFG